MKFFNLLVLLVITLSLACKKDKIKIDCIDSQLEAIDMVPYTGQEIGCKFYLQLYHYNGKQYFMNRSICVNSINVVKDCEGNDFCTDALDISCNNFFEIATSIGIIGVQE